MPRRGRSAATLLLLLGFLSRVSLAALEQPKHPEGGDGGGRQLLLFNSSSIFSSSAAATLFSSNARSTLAAPSSPSLGGGRPDGAYSVDLWAGKQIITTKHEPASHCGVISPVAFRSKVPVPIARKCFKTHKDVPRYSVLLARPGTILMGKISSIKAWLHAEYVAMWDNVSRETHSSASVHAPWQRVLNGPNDALIFARGNLGLPDIADRMLRTTAARLAILVTDPSTQLQTLSSGWLDNAAAMFHEHPRLGVIGMSAGKLTGFSFTMDAGNGPWVVRRDAMIEAGAVGYVDFCMHSCPIGQGLAAIAWMGGFQVVQMTQDAVAWPVRHVPLPQGSLTSCVKLGGKAVNGGAISTAVSRARQAADTSGATTAIVAVDAPCRPFKVVRGPVRVVPATCGGTDGRKVVASIAIQYFRRPRAIKAMASALKSIKEPIEILVNDDSRSQHDEWLAALDERGVLFHHPNIHEIRGYNRLARFARGDMIIMMQDDDQPSNRIWVSQARALFDAHQLLGMIGGLRGRLDTGKKRDKETNQNDGQKFGPRFSRIKGYDSRAKVPFMFMYKVNAAPLVARRHAMMQLGGLQEGFSCPGDAGIGFDFEYSIHLWKVGYQVGLYDVAFKRPQPGSRGKAGTRSDDKKWNIRRHNEKLNNGLLYRMYPGFHHTQGTKMALAAQATIPRG